MDKNRIISFFVLIACFASNHCFCQQQNGDIAPAKFRAIQYTLDNGLTADNGHTMLKDAEGFLWVGSVWRQLSRFDGMTFKHFIPDPKKSGAINSDRIYSFKEDRLGNIWIGTARGLSRFDIKADTFTNFSPYIDSAFSDLKITPFWSTENEIFCKEPGSIITRINLHNLDRKILVHLPKEVDPVIHQNTNKTFFDAQSNSIWMLGLNERGTIEQIFVDGKSSKTYQFPCYKNDRRHRHNAEDMVYDPGRNSIWINSGEGLLQFSLKEKQFRRIESIHEITHSNEYNRGVGIEVDNAGRIWFSTFHKGIFIYDPEADAVQPVFPDSDQQQKSGEANLHIYCDRSGIIWTSNWSTFGIIEIIPIDPPVTSFITNRDKKDSLSNPSIFGIFPATNSEIWVGTEDGLNILNTTTNRFSVLRQKDLQGVPGKFISPFYIDTILQKALIYCVSRGPASWTYYMYEMDMRTKKPNPISFRHREKILSNPVKGSLTAIHPYRNGVLFSDEWNGIFEIKENSRFADLVIPSKRRNNPSTMTVEDRYVFLHETETRNICYENKNGKWIQTPHPFDSLEWRVIYYDRSDQTTWVSLKYELAQYDKDFRKIKSYVRQDGYDSPAWGMIRDNKGNLWYMDERGQIKRLDIHQGITTTLSEADGYKKQPAGFQIYTAKDQRGDIYFGTGQFGNINSGGLIRISPEKYESHVTSSVYLGSLLVNQRPFSNFYAINKTAELSLPFNQNTIILETGILDFYANGKGGIRYKLEEEGKAEDWQYVPNYYTIRFEKLPPGNYTLTIQASNAVFEFNSPQKILQINISPPYWNTGWFRVVAILFVLSLLYGFIHYRSRNLKKRNMLLEKKVTDRTNKLSQSLSELKTAQDQLIQSEKMASLGELTSGIAHEIKNPLNFINNFSELNMELIAELEEEETKNPDERYRAHIGQIITTLKKNSEKINHHGKRVDGIVKGMLQHSRMANASKERVDINSLCDESLKLAYHGFKAKEKTFNAFFETRFDPELPNVMVFPQDLGRVMINLINNAFYAVHEKKKRNQSESSDDALQIESLYKPCVIVSTKKNGSKIFITVSDNGMGIPSPVMNKIFQPFFTTKPTGEGTGLGLSMSYDIISKSHGGELRAKTKEGLGTDFEIVLPVS